MDKRHQISVLLETLLPLLAERLYGNPEVFLRELICNGYDAIRRRTALPSDRDAPQKVSLQVSNRTTLAVEDTGIGMTETDIHRFLSCIGSSATRMLHHGHEDIVGQFGIGFLSVMAVAASIRIDTRSAMAQQQPCSWYWRGGLDYHITPIQRSVVGTRVEVELTNKYLEFADVTRLCEVVTYHLPWLPVQIEIEPLGEVRSRSSWADIQEPDGIRRVVNPRDLLHVPDDSLHVFAASWAHGGAVFGFHGSSLQGTGRVAIHHHGVLVDPENTALLPEAWRWVSGSVDCTQANLHLDRSGIHDDHWFSKLRVRICSILTSEFTWIATHDEKLFAKLVDKHRICIAKLIVEDPELLHAIGHSYRFTTTLGERTFREMQRTTTDVLTLFYISVPPETELRWPTARAAGQLVIWCRDPAEIRLLCALAEMAASIEVRELGWEMTVAPTESPELLTPRVRHWLHRLQDIFAQHSIEIEAMHLQPASVPAIAQLPDLLQEDEGHLDYVDSDDLRIIESFLGALMSPRATPVALGRLILNQDSPVVTTLASLPESRCPLVLSASLLLTTGVVQSGLAIPEEWLPALEHLVVDGAQALTTLDEGLEETSHTVCFFAHAFAKQGYVLDELRGLLEHAPYFWEVRSATDLQRDAMLYENVYLQIWQSHVVIADLTDWNPNVLLELGLSLGLKDQKEIIVIAERQSYRPFSDMNGRLVYFYETNRRGIPTSSFGPDLHAYLASNPDFRYARKRYPFLGFRLLSERSILSTREVSTLRAEWQDPIEFLAAPDAQVARLTGIPSRKIAKAKDYFSERLRQHQRAEDLFEASLKTD